MEMCDQWCLFKSAAGCDEATEATRKLGHQRLVRADPQGQESGQRVWVGLLIIRGAKVT